MQVAIKAVESGRDLEGENFHREVRMNKILPAHANIVRFIDSATVILMTLSPRKFARAFTDTQLDGFTCAHARFTQIIAYPAPRCNLSYTMY